MTTEVWWGEYSFEQLQQRVWQVGGRAIILRRLANEWNSWNIEAEEELDEPIQCKDNCTVEYDEQLIHGRFLQQNTSDSIRVLPLLADRSIVARPATPLTLLPGQRSRLYVSTPIWFQAKSLPSEALLLDIPFWRPSDSWFGSSTREGQIVYAKYTSARIQLDKLERKSHRAITPITVINIHKEALVIERINVPVTLLHLYSDSTQQLWTTSIEVKREEDNGNVELTLEKQAPPEANIAQLVNSPREASEGNRLIRSISSLFA